MGSSQPASQPRGQANQGTELHNQVNHPHNQPKEAHMGISMTKHGKEGAIETLFFWGGGYRRQSHERRRQR